MLKDHFKFLSLSFLVLILFASSLLLVLQTYDYRSSFSSLENLKLEKQELSFQSNILLEDGGPCYECIFPGLENNANEFDCNAEGVLGVTTAMVGSYMAAETIKYICDTGKILANKLLIIDCLNGSFELFSVEKNIKCMACNRE